MSSVVVDFGREKEAGYQKVFAQLPRLSSVAANWDQLYIAYDYFWPEQTPEILAKQHGIAIFIDYLPLPRQSAGLRKLDAASR